MKIMQNQGEMFYVIIFQRLLILFQWKDMQLSFGATLPLRVIKGHTYVKKKEVQHLFIIISNQYHLQVYNPY